ncbi:MAG: hypothetical protein R3B67_03920 [Phycisphaerales bacterium]
MGELVLTEQMLTPYLEQDLAFFGVDTTSIEPTKGTRRYIDHINDHADQPLHLLGLHYVRLAACNGNRFVARVVRKAYELGETEGTRYPRPLRRKAACRLGRVQGGPGRHALRCK